jgi:hypothetical protein
VTRNFDLIRSFAFQIENAPSGEPMHQIAAPEDVDEAEIGEHLELMIEAGLIAGQVVSLRPLAFQIERLTWAGHDFVNNARNDTIWKKVMAEAKSKGQSITLTIINGLLTKAAEKYAGLEKP